MKRFYLRFIFVTGYPDSDLQQLFIYIHYWKVKKSRLAEIMQMNRDPFLQLPVWAYPDKLSGGKIGLAALAISLSKWWGTESKQTPGNSLSHTQPTYTFMGTDFFLHLGAQKVATGLHPRVVIWKMKAWNEDGTIQCSDLNETKTWIKYGVWGKSVHFVFSSFLCQIWV
jgi:hypothetical protein